MRELDTRNLLRGRVLDLGCGHGFDADYLKIDGYDPYHRPVLGKGKYDVITCNYVLNVISAWERKQVLAHIKQLLKKNGTAYITVRRDIKKDYVTKRGTQQYCVELPLPVLFEHRDFIIYEMKNDLCDEE
jgi:2-polyprenyl-3-methyl-5-hydroxy-6-metoxy-1,4-benzoquinol methylase